MVMLFVSVMELLGASTPAFSTKKKLLSQLSYSCCLSSALTLAMQLIMLFGCCQVASANVVAVANGGAVVTAAAGIIVVT